MMACWPVYDVTVQLCASSSDLVPAPSSRSARCSVICVKGDPPLNGIVSVAP